LLRPLKCALAVLRNHHAPGSAMKKTNAQLRLEDGNALADVRRRGADFE